MCPAWRDPHERFHEKYQIDASGCWIWTGARHRRGYGWFWHDGACFAHKWAWVQQNGSVPDGLELDHICRNTSCVNPRHLEAVTHRINVRRGRLIGNNAKTHCPSGHPYSGANLGIRKKDGTKYCRACHRLYSRRRRQRLRNAA